MRLLISVLALLSVLGSVIAAQAGIDSGGGDALILSNSSVILADPFYRIQNEGSFHCKPGEQGHLSPELIRGLRIAGLLMVRYGATPAPWANIALLNDQSKFIEESVLGSDVEYCFVNELPKHESDTLAELPTGAESHALAYTEGSVTWIQQDLFKKLTLKDQILSIIHERLHGYAGNVPHAPIIAMTNGLATALAFFAREIAGGERPLLVQSQVKTLQDMVVAIDNLRLSPRTRYFSTSKTHYIVANGGGLAHRNSSIASTAFVSIGSYVPEKGSIGERAALINSTLCMTISPILKTTDVISPYLLVAAPNAIGYFVGSSSTLKNVDIGRCQTAVYFGQDVRIEDSVIALNAKWNTELSIGDGSVIERSTLVGASRFVLGTRGQITEVTLFFTPDQRFANPDPLQFEAGDDVNLRNLKALEIKGLATPPHRSEHRIKIPNQATIDFENKNLCSNDDAYYYWLEIKNSPRLKSVRDFKAHCRN